MRRELAIVGVLITFGMFGVGGASAQGPPRSSGVGPAEIDRLISAVEKAPTARGRDSAAEDLERAARKACDNGRVDAIAPLLTALEGPDEWPGLIAIEALSGLEQENVLCAIVRLLLVEKGRPPDGRELAFQRLGPLAMRPLLAALQDRDPEVNRVALRAFGSLGPGAREALQAIYLGELEKYISSAVVEAEAERADPDPPPPDGIAGLIFSGLNALKAPREASRKDLSIDRIAKVHDLDRQQAAALYDLYTFGKISKQSRNAPAERLPRAGGASRQGQMAPLEDHFEADDRASRPLIRRKASKLRIDGPDRDELDFLLVDFEVDPGLASAREAVKADSVPIPLSRALVALKSRHAKVRRDMLMQLMFAFANPYEPRGSKDPRRHFTYQSDQVAERAIAAAVLAHWKEYGEDWWPAEYHDPHVVLIGTFGPGNPGALVFLKDILRSTKGQWADGGMQWAIGYFGLDHFRASPREAIALLSEEIDRGSKTRLTAITALGLMGPAARPAAPKLRELLPNTDEACRVSAAEALVLIGDPCEQAIDVLIRSLKAKGKASETPGSTSVMAALANAREAGKPAVPTLSAIAADPAEDANHRATAEWAVFSIRVDRRDVPALRDGLMRDNESIRRTAASLLGALGPSASDAAPRLLELMASDGDVFYLALKAIGSRSAAAADARAEVLNREVEKKRRENEEERNRQNRRRRGP